MPSELRGELLGSYGFGGGMSEFGVPLLSSNSARGFGGGMSEFGVPLFAA